MTDLLGVCTAWGDGVCVVVPDSGPAVTIPIADIVSGKPVPPRPSPRLRVTPRAAQVRAFALFPDLMVTPLDGPSGWLMRSSATATARRANSVLAFPGSGSFGAPEVEAVEAHYAALGKPAVAAVLADSEERSFLASLGWVPESHDADTQFQLASVASVARALRDVNTSGVTVKVDGNVAEAVVPGLASGFAAYADDWVGFRSIEVDPAARRQGLGRAVMAALLEWGAELGATSAYLQVLGHNAPALALYDSMGFNTHHAYAYLTPPGSAHSDEQGLRSAASQPRAARMSPTLRAVEHERLNTWPQPKRRVSRPSTAASRSRSRSASRARALSWNSRPSSST
jgi:ribosomal protein S18 acetylase RimI-like enzyme